MAKVKTSNGQMTTDLFTEVSLTVMKSLKIAAARRGTTMRALVEEALRKHLTKEIREQEES